MLARAMVGLMMSAAAACAGPASADGPAVAGCHASQAGQPAAGPIPRDVARRLPAGVFYLLAGPNDNSLNLWQVTNSGCEWRLTHIRGFGLSDFGASRAGVILSEAPTGVDQLARLGPHGPVPLPDGAVSTVGIDPAGRVVYIRG